MTFGRLNMMKRFYKSVSLRKNGDFFQVLLDGRAVKTPSLAPFSVPSPDIAFIAMAEFAAQRDFILFASMPMFSLSVSFLDASRSQTLLQVAETRLKQFLAGDTLTFLDHNPELRELQTKKFGRALEKLHKNFGISLEFKEDMHSLGQPATQPELEALLRSLVTWQKFALDSASGLLKSTGLALLLCFGHITPSKALELSRLEEKFQVDRFGAIEEFHGIEETEIELKLTAIRLFWKLMTECPNQNLH